MISKKYKLTAIPKIKRAIWGRRPLSIELGVILVYIPTDLVENIRISLLGKFIDASDPLHFPRLEIAEENVQHVKRSQTASSTREEAHASQHRRDCSTVGSDRMRVLV